MFNSRKMLAAALISAAALSFASAARADFMFDLTPVGQTVNLDSASVAANTTFFGTDSVCCRGTEIFTVAYISGLSSSSAFVIAQRCPNLLWDTSLSYNFDFLEQFAQQLGADRVVFGTDLYSPPLGRRISHLVPQILESSLSDDDKAKIFGGNARQLFGLP